MLMPGVNSYLVGEEMAGIRLDLFLVEQKPDLTRSHIQKLVAGGMVQVNGGAVRVSYRVRPGDMVDLRIPEPGLTSVEPEGIPLDIRYEDEHLIVINKPRGMVVHPAGGNYSGTMVNALMHYCRDLSGINGVLRPGIVHRLDKDTSGLLVVAKNDQAHLSLAEQLQQRTVIRNYVALVHGRVQESKGMVDAPIGRHPADRQRMAVVAGGKAAITRYQVARRLDNYTYLELRLETGRTHQIRVHLDYLGHPVAGDNKYGPARPHFGLDGQFLHAYRLGFSHPVSGDYLEFTSELPAVLAAVLQELGWGGPYLPDSRCARKLWA